MSRCVFSAVLSVSLAYASVAAAQQDPGAVARILLVESTAPLRVTLKVEAGYVMNGVELDVFSPRQRRPRSPRSPDTWT